MYATLDILEPGQDCESADLMLEPISRPVRLAVTLSDQLDSGSPDSSYRLVHYDDTTDGVELPFAHVVWFSGPRADAMADAADYARIHRIEPALRDLPARIFVLRRADNAEVVIAAAPTLEQIHEAITRVMATELLPGEDPAMFGTPDLAEIAWVRRIPAAIESMGAG